VKRIHLIYTLICVVVSIHAAYTQNYLQREEEWVSNILNNMTLEEKIGQMIMVRAYSKGELAEKDYIEHLIKTYHIGGICFFQGKPQNQKNIPHTFKKYPNIRCLSLRTENGDWACVFRRTPFLFPEICSSERFRMKN
jgi:hypothetical protein